jgi:hypothetical protein
MDRFKPAEQANINLENLLEGGKLPAAKVNKPPPAPPVMAPAAMAPRGIVNHLQQAFGAIGQFRLFPAPPIRAFDPVRTLLIIVYMFHMRA